MRKIVLTAAALLLATPALADSSATITSSGPPGNNDNYTFSASGQGLSSVSFGQTSASAQAGETHVAASVQQGPSPNGSTYTRQASAGWTEGLSILSPTIANGTFTVNILIDGSESVQNSAGFGSSISLVRYEFFDTTDPLQGGPGGNIATWLGRVTDYGSFKQVQVPGNGGTIFGLFSFTVPFVAGDTIMVNAFSSCTATANLQAGGTANDICDLGHSSYWMGISAIQDGNGNIIQDASVVSQGSFNLSEASPNAPSAAATVPEASTWAMMLAGFGAIGFTMRRTRRAAFAR